MYVHKKRPRYISPSTKRWFTLTYGETSPYEWCVYEDNTPLKRFRNSNEAIAYMQELTS